MTKVSSGASAASVLSRLAAHAPSLVRSAAIRWTPRSRDAETTQDRADLSQDRRRRPK